MKDLPRGKTPTPTYLFAEAEALHLPHATYYLGLMEEQELAIVQPEAATWMERLEREHDNCWTGRR